MSNNGFDVDMGELHTISGRIRGAGDRAGMVA
jgi:hypothetical protein